MKTAQEKLDESKVIAIFCPTGEIMNESYSSVREAKEAFGNRAKLQINKAVFVPAIGYIKLEYRKAKKLNKNLSIMKTIKFEESVGFVISKEEYTHEMNAIEIMESFRDGRITNQVFFKTNMHISLLSELGWSLEDGEESYSVVEIRYNGRAKSIQLIVTNPDNNECFSLADNWDSFGGDSGVTELFSYLIENELILNTEGAIDHF